MDRLNPIARDSLRSVNKPWVRVGLVSGRQR